MRFGGQFVDMQTDVARAGKADKAGSGVAHQGIADQRPAAGNEVEGISGEACFEQYLHEECSNGGGVAGRLDDDGVTGDQGGYRHPGENGQREVPGWNNHAHSEGLITHFALFTRELEDRMRASEAGHIASVVVTEVDGFAGLGFGLRPGFPGLKYQPGIKFHATCAQDFGRPGGGGDADDGRGAAPATEGRVGSFDRAGGQQRCRLVVEAKDLLRPGRIGAGEGGTRLHALAADQ